MITKREIQQHVKDSSWQKFRLSLKGLSTSEKLAKLKYWRIKNPGRASEVQVENYINALKRGGQI